MLRVRGTPSRPTLPRIPVDEPDQPAIFGRSRLRGSSRCAGGEAAPGDRAAVRADTLRLAAAPGQGAVVKARPLCGGGAGSGQPDPKGDLSCAVWAEALFVCTRRAAGAGRVLQASFGGPGDQDGVWAGVPRGIVCGVRREETNPEGPGSTQAYGTKAAWRGALRARHV
jgi:hypothetical protein